jgi:phosphocarrier protein FPr
MSVKATLLAPLSGPLVPLEDVPDAVFARKLVGDGVSVDPETSCLRAPCGARVQLVHSAGHAVNLVTDAGIEVILHVGLDTVELKGEGFLPRIKAGDQVQAGDPLIDFAADYVATHAKSLLTQIIVPACDRVLGVVSRRGRVEAGRDVILELSLAPDEALRGLVVSEAQEPNQDSLVSEPIVVPLATGLHARPAATLAHLAKGFRSRLRLLRGGKFANAKSVTAIMGLDVGAGDAVSVEATGPDAPEALAALVTLLTSGLGEEGEAVARAAGVGTARPRTALAAPPKPASPATPRSADKNLLLGVSAAPGLAVGRIFQLRRDQIAVAETGVGPHEERQRLTHALEQARLQLEALQSRLRAEADPGKAAIFAAHAEIVDDPDLLELAEAAIASGKSAGAAWRDAVTTHADRLASSRQELLAARADDLRDVGRRVLRLLAGAEPAGGAAVPEQAILVAEDLGPSEAAGLDRTRVLGFCTVTGGATSHVAILARSLGIPAVAGIEARALEIPDDTTALLDGARGTLRLHPSDDEVSAMRARQERLATRNRAHAAAALEPAVTRDGRRVEVAANVGDLADAERAVALGAESVGLLRSEFLFLDRTSAPDEEEQFATYGAIAKTLGPERTLIIRTLDVGGDKPLPYLPLPREENPFLGVRGLRLLLDHADVLRTQVRAILRAAASGRVAVMLPMVATLDEWRAAKALIEEERERLGVAPVPLGIMVEVPSAALMADAFAREVDFFSVGTNDLTQYTLAMDRGHPKLAPFVDALHPAVLRLIAQTTQAAEKNGRMVGVCGGLASDLQAVPVLVGLGVTELSVSVPQIPAVKARIRELSFAECRALAEKALDAATAAEVRALLVGVDE